MRICDFFLQLFSCRTKTVEAARADGEKIRLIGAAEARATEAVGRFEIQTKDLVVLIKLQSGLRQSE